jgi:hypothetical protein
MRKNAVAVKKILGQNLSRSASPLLQIQRVRDASATVSTPGIMTDILATSWNQQRKNVS